MDNSAFFQEIVQNMTTKWCSLDVMIKKRIKKWKYEIINDIYLEEQKFVFVLVINKP